MKQFKTESKKLLDLMINSIYTNKEIFLRELISNASDAIDKLSFKSLTDPSVKIDQKSLPISVSFDKDVRTITVSDNGIGMTEDELDKNLGTIAHSGSQQFKDEIEKASDNKDDADSIDIIGQFGVGFYSAFMVAKKVRVVSRALGAEKAYAWESDGITGYTIDPAKPDERPNAEDHGTDVIVYLKDSTKDEDTDKYLNEYTLQELIKKYSNYVRHPIQMMVTKSRQKPKPKDAGDDYKPEYEDYQELDTINSMTPIWKKQKSEVEQKDYDEFYESTFHDWAKPLKTLSFHTEGTVSYDALLFIPSQAPFDLYSKDYQKGLALYSNNVLIQEKCADLLPDYYNFVHGVVDSPDIQLNISRETLQQSAQLRAIARRVEKKITQTLQDMRDNDRENYIKFFNNFGRGLKFGIYNSYGSKASELADLLLFWSAKEKKFVTFKEYVKAMPKDQDKIYYAAGESQDRLAKMPVVDSAIKHGYDVLLCTQDVDEFMFQIMRSYHIDAVAGDSEHKGTDARDLEFQNISKSDVDFATKDEKDEAKKATDENKDLFDAMKKALGDKVTDVTVTAGLTDTPARITATGPVSLEMERVIAQGPEADKTPKAQRVLELNPTHPVFAKLVQSQKDGDEDKLKLYSNILYNQALLVEGLPIDDPVQFAADVTKLM